MIGIIKSARWYCANEEQSNFEKKEKCARAVELDNESELRHREIPGHRHVTNCCNYVTLCCITISCDTFTASGSGKFCSR